MSPDLRDELGRPPLLVVTIARTYRFDVDAIVRDFEDEIRADLARGDRDLDDVLRETFYELCGTWADHDHVSGQLVYVEDQDDDFDSTNTWERIVERAEELLDA